MNHTFSFFVTICTVMFFPPKIGQRLNCFCHVYSLGLCQTHLQHTKANSILADQIAYTVGHGAPGTFDLMNHHLLHVKCHCRFTLLEEDEFSISATKQFLIFFRGGMKMTDPRQHASEMRIRTFCIP